MEFLIGAAVAVVLYGIFIFFHTPPRENTSPEDTFEELPATADDFPEEP